METVTTKQRTIKFRAWDKIMNKMAYPKLWDSSMPTNWKYWYILNQFTGLYDKDGNEIYEGDIIKLDDIIAPITWDDGGFQMITSENQGKSAAIQDRVKNFEVIGNIYEHPNLLKLWKR